MAAFALTRDLNYSTYCIENACGFGFAEPTTSITDFILGVVLVAMAVVMLTLNRSMLAITWSVAWVLLGVAFVLGGLHHFLALDVLCSDHTKLCRRFDWYWIFSILTQCPAVTLMMVATVQLTIKPLNQIVVWAIFGVLVFAYTISVIIAVVVGAAFPLTFIFVAIFLLPSVLGMIVVLSLPVCCRYRPPLYLTATSERKRASVLALAGWALCVFSLVWQPTKIGIHKHFNHNDIFHVLLTIGLIICACGIIPLTSAKAREDAGAPAKDDAKIKPTMATIIADL